jgi:AraC-like DNA-binding protein
LRLEGGVAAGELVRRERLERAGQLLRNTDRPIGEVGSAVGIDDQNYFARWFRIHTGQTPSRWRSAMRDSNQGA